MILSPNEMAWCLAQAGFTGTCVVDGVTTSNVVIGTAIGLAESGGNTDALGKVLTSTSGNFDHGWMQVSNLWHGAKLQSSPNWRDPLTNAQLARAVFLERLAINNKAGNGLPGWSGWSTWTSGAFKKWLPFAKIGAESPFRPVTPNYNPTFTVNAPAVTIDPTTIPLTVSVNHG